MVEVTVSGADRLHAFSARLREAGEKGLGRQMANGIGKALDPVKKAIDDEARTAAPSGYRRALTSSLKHRRAVRSSTRQASVQLITYADGRRQRRDLPAFNAGKLRHPVFGRRLKPWTVTRVRAGFHDRGTARAGDEAERELLKVVDEYAEIITKG